MPNHEEHCQDSERKYGVRAEDIHRWMDQPSYTFRSGHRQFRHDSETVEQVGRMFGPRYEEYARKKLGISGRKLAEDIALDHINLDHHEEVERREQQREQQEREQQAPPMPVVPPSPPTTHVPTYYEESILDEVLPYVWVTAIAMLIATESIFPSYLAFTPFITSVIICSTVFLLTYLYMHRLTHRLSRKIAAFLFAFVFYVLLFLWIFHVI